MSKRNRPKNGRRRHMRGCLCCGTLYDRSVRLRKVWRQGTPAEGGSLTEDVKHMRCCDGCWEMARKTATASRFWAAVCELKKIARAEARAA